MSCPDIRASAWDLPVSEWSAVCEKLGLPAYRAKQIVTGLYCDRISAWDALSTLPRELRSVLQQNYPVVPLKCDTIAKAKDGVSKLLLECVDGELIETVLIPSKHRLTQCISSQVGCAFKCSFCASGAAGFRRNLGCGEIVGQVMAAAEILKQGLMPYQMPGNIVVMGMGEPFDNYDNVIQALRILNCQQGINIGARHITLSTCGVVPGIERLALEGVQFELSVSLHAPDDQLRNQLMPVNRRWNISTLLDAADAYTVATGRLVTYEYTLIEGLNNLPQHAHQLINLLKSRMCKVNLIPLSPVTEFKAKAPSHDRCMLFMDALLKAGIKTTMRHSRGRERSAACGQLRLCALS